MKLRIDRPEDHHVKDLAPRIQIVQGDFKNEWGYALCLTDDDKVMIFTDTEGIQYVPVDQVLFMTF